MIKIQITEVVKRPDVVITLDARTADSIHEQLTEMTLDAELYDFWDALDDIVEQGKTEAER